MTGKHETFFDKVDRYRKTAETFYSGEVQKKVMEALDEEVLFLELQGGETKAVKIKDGNIINLDGGIIVDTLLLEDIQTPEGVMELLKQKTKLAVDGIREI